MRYIGPNHGAEILRRKLQEMDSQSSDTEASNFAIDTVLGEPGKQYDPDFVRRATGTLRILAEDHDELLRMDIPGQIAALKQEVAAVKARPFV